MCKRIAVVLSLSCLWCFNGMRAEEATSQSQEAPKVEEEKTATTNEKAQEQPAAQQDAAATTPEVTQPSGEQPVAAAAEAPKAENPSNDEPPAKKQKVEGEADGLAGIDTVNVDEPSGNWLYKRLYWERAEDKYQKIKELMAAIFDARTKFFNQRVELDKNIFDPLYNTANFSRGELSAILKDLLEDIDKQKSSKKEESEESRILFAKIEANKERLEEVKKEIEFINKIDAAVDEAINTLIGLINQARNFETQAWGDFKAISRELSDKKARDLFYRIDTYWKNIKDIEVYATTKLTEHMNYLATTAQQHADVVKGLLKELADQGFVLKEQVEALEKAKMPAQEVEVAPKPKSTGFFASIGSIFSWLAKPFVAIAKALWHTITIPFNYFFGDKKPAQQVSIPAAPEVVSEGDAAKKQSLPEAS